MIKALHDPILEDGIPFTAYFNGRLLSGEDLARDQQGNREARQRIGQAVGDGIAYGLEVFETAGQSTRTAPIVTVQPGVAVNRSGETLALRTQVDLRLVQSSGDSTGASATTFRVCDERRPGVYVVGDGIYVLAMACAEGAQGRALVSGLGNVASSCNVRTVVQGVQFRLVQPAISPQILADRARLRNRMAAFSLGIAERAAPYDNPWSEIPQVFGLIDTLRATGALTDCDVPLGLLHWTASEGITFVDMWSVRRRVTPRSADVRWPWLCGERAEGDAEARFFQFQEYVEDMAGSGEDLSAVVAADRFEILPPLGILPLQIGTRKGFDPQTFFGTGVLSRDVAYTDGRLLRPLLRESFAHDPINVAAQERLQLYLLLENTQAAAAGRDVTPVVVFASGTLPYRGVSRFGSARWERGRFASRVI